ncbi:MAG TPA: DNA-protecting protein DprA, partial [Sphingomonadaceae bacterium]|nr:DNA-protecting protein DprA [Sphingomonadaceae bacterium]
MLPEDGIARLRLIRTPTIGPITYGQLLARFGSASRALEAVPDLARRGGGKPPTLATRGAIEREIAAVAALGARYLFREHSAYPPLLAAIESAPPVLVVKGDGGLTRRPAVAMV